VSNALTVARTTSTKNATTTHSPFDPDARPPRYVNSRPRFPSAPPDCLPVSHSLLILILGHVLLAAAPPPALSLICLGCPARFIWQVEEGPSSAKRWTALPRKPRCDAGSPPEAGRRRGLLQRGPPREDHLDRTTHGGPTVGGQALLDPRDRTRRATASKLSGLAREFAHVLGRRARSSRKQVQGGAGADACRSSGASVSRLNSATLACVHERSSAPRVRAITAGAPELHGRR